MEIEFPAENVPCGSIDLWIAERTEIVGRIEEADLNPEAAERLAEFEGYDPGADDCETFRQVFEIEDCVAGDDPLGEVVKRRRYPRGTAGSDDYRTRLDTLALDVERGGVQEAGTAPAALGGGNFLGRCDHPAGEAVTFPANPRHDRSTVDLKASRRPDTEDLRPAYLFGTLGGGYQKLGRHAADPGTGGSVSTGLDQQRPATAFLDLGPRI